MHIFMSYSSKDSKFAKYLTDHLVRSGFTMWMDQLGGIKLGDDWILNLQNGINNAVGMIAVISPPYVRSKYCRNELARADQLSKPIFPILLHSVEPDDYPLEVQRTQYLDFTNWGKQNEFKLSFNELAEILEIKYGPDIKSATSKTLSVSQKVSLKDVDEQFQQMQTSISTESETSTSTLRTNRIARQVELLGEEYEAVLQELYVNVDPISRKRLERRISQIEDIITSLQKSL